VTRKGGEGRKPRVVGKARQDDSGSSSESGGGASSPSSSSSSSSESEDRRRGGGRGRRGQAPKRSPAESSSEEESAGEMSDEESGLNRPRARPSAALARAPPQPPEDTAWIQSLIMAAALFIIGIALAYIMAPDQVAAGVSTVAKKFDNTDDAVIMQGFLIGLNEHGCPDGTTHLTDKSECQKMADVLQRRWGGHQKTAGLEGCYVRGFNVYFNMRSTKSVAEPEVHFVCEFGVTYGQLGSTECPPQSSPIHEENLCQKAALVLSHGWAGATEIDHKPQGCYEQEELVSLNLHGQAGGSMDEDSKMICLHTLSAARAP